MVIHKRTRITPLQRKELIKLYYVEHTRVCDLKRKYSISVPTVYKIIYRAKIK